MVFEELYSQQTIERRPYLVFFIAIAYSVISIAVAMLLFREFNTSTISLAFISLMLVVTLRDTFTPIEKLGGGLREVLLTLYTKHLKIFFFAYAGILLTFATFSILLPPAAASNLFSAQQGLIENLLAHEIFANGGFLSILLNNLSVLLACVLTAFFFGLGTMFLFIIVWNASVVGVVFGVVAQHTAELSGQSALFVFLMIFLAALPHILLEMLGYFMGGMLGEELSSWMMQRNISKKLVKALVLSSSALAIGALIIGTYLEITFAPAVIMAIL